MAAPSVVQTKVLSESADATSHVIPAFSSVSAHDVLYWVAIVSQTPGISVANGGDVSMWQIKDPTGATGANTKYVFIRGLVRDAQGVEGPVTITTGVARLCAAVAVQLRGASIPPDPFTDEQIPRWPPQNPELETAPGIQVDRASHVVPGEGSGIAGPASTVVTAFVRAGRLTFNTSIVDNVGNGISHGAPYVVYRSSDLYPNKSVASGGSDGSNTKPFTVDNHAESTNGPWKLQAALAHRQCVSNDFAGDSNLDVFTSPGQIAYSYWPVNALGAAAGPVLTSLAGIRIKGS